MHHVLVFEVDSSHAIVYNHKATGFNLPAAAAVMILVIPSSL